MRTRGAQIGTHPVVMDVPLDGPISSHKEGLERHENGLQGKRNQGALFVSPCPAMTWRNL